MKLADLEKASILILGFGAEGQATYEFLRRRWPSKRLSVADQRAVNDFPQDLATRIQGDPALTVDFGEHYLDSLTRQDCNVIIKTPGIPAAIPAIAQARQAGCKLTSHSQIFLSNYPHEKVIGVTGTKGKSTTSSLIHHIFVHADIQAELVGNIGQPPLARIDAVKNGTYFVHEFSSHQLAEIEDSPHVAVLLNIVPEHLDYYASFDEYVAAKENITKFQTPEDVLVFAADYPIPNAIASRTKASLRPFHSHDDISQIIEAAEVPLPGKFNLQNVMAAITVASLFEIPQATIRDAIRTFRALPHRLQSLGTFRGITFYDDSIATVPDATLAAVEALGPNVQTLILGGHERNLDFTQLGESLPENIKTLILFPPTGTRIWQAVERRSKNAALPEAFFVRDMEQAVKIAYEHTEQGKICLLSPAAPSFGIFKDYRERGDLFNAFVRKLSKS